MLNTTRNGSKVSSIKILDRQRYRLSVEGAVKRDSVVSVGDNIG